MRKGIFIAVCCLLSCWPQGTRAQEPAPTKKQEAIRELLVVTDASKTAMKVMDAMLGEMSRQYPRMAESVVNATPGLTPVQRQKLKEGLGENQARYLMLFQERIKQRIDLGKVMEDISYSLYDKYFSEDEIRDLAAFYKTTTGKKTLSILPQLLTESIQQAGEKLSPAITSIIMEIMAEETERIKRTQ